MAKKGISEKREKLKQEFFKDEDAWTGENEKGWFRAPRTLPLVLELLSSKNLSGNLDPTRVYLELLSRHIDSGIIEMTDEGAHAFAAGYFNTRAIRTWQERMKKLEEIGFIKTKQIGNQRYKYVLLVHPTVAVQKLREEGKIDEIWWDTYRARQIEIKEDSFAERQQKKLTNVIQMPIAVNE